MTARPSVRHGASPDPLPVAGRYRLQEKLAEGGVGVVYRADDLSTGATVALKQLLPEATADRRLVMLFEREYRTLAQLQHPRVIDVFDYGVERTGPYYTMELLDGTDLGELAPIGYRRACQYLRDVASSLSLLHTRRLLHRDLSPRNVRRTSDDRCKLMDFGTMATFGVATEVVGTPPLIAPECLRGAALDHRTDLYSLGALAYRLLTRRYAYRARQIEELPELWRHAPPRPSAHIANIPSDLDDLVLAMLNLDPLLRPATVGEVVDRLTSIADLEPEADLGEAARSYLVSAKLVAREQIMERIKRRMARATRGRGSTLIVEGNAGVGKSRVLDEAALVALLGGALTARIDARADRGSNAVSADLLKEILTAAPTDAREAMGSDAGPLTTLVDRRADRPTSADAPKSPFEGRVHSAILGFLGRLLLRRPLVLLVDDLHLADAASLAMLAALAHEAGHRPMLIIATRRVSESASNQRAVAVLESLAVVARVRSLRRTETNELVTGVFGRSANVDNLAHTLHRITLGNPMQTMMLCQHMVERGIVHYVAGLWVVPPDIPSDQVPQDLTAAMMTRVQALNAEAHSLARALCVRRGLITLEMCVKLTKADEPHVFSSLDELVRHGVLVHVGGHYLFGQRTLREALLKEMEDDERRESHLRLGNALLAQRSLSADETVEAGFHVHQGGEAARGADLIAVAAEYLPPRGAYMEAAVPALEAALKTCVDERRPPIVILKLSTALVVCSARHASERHAAATIAQLSRYAGLPLARRLTTALGSGWALRAGYAWSWLLRLVTHAERRGPHPRIATTMLTRCLYGLLPVRAAATDAPGLERLADVAGLLRPIPGLGHVTHDLLTAASSSLAAEHRIAATHLDQVIRTLTEGDTSRDLSSEALRGILAGAYVVQGFLQAHTAIESRTAMGTIDALEALGRDPRFSNPHAGIARDGGLAASEILRAVHQLRSVYHSMRGESEVALVQIDQLALRAGQRGMYWQFDVRRALSATRAATISLDLAALRHATEHVKQLLQSNTGDTPIAHYALQTGLAAMELARDRPQQCLDLLATEPSEDVRLVGWETRTLVRIRALRQLGRFAEGYDIAEHAWLDLDSRGCGALFESLLLRCSLSIDAARLRRMNEAETAFRYVEAEVKRADHPTLMTAYHEAGAWLAWATTDAKQMLQQIERAQHWAGTTHNPAVISRAQKWALALRSVATAEPTGSEAGPEQTIAANIGHLMAGSHTRGQRAGRALRFLLDQTSAMAGHLFDLQADGDLALVASVDRQAPPDALEQQVRRRIEIRGHSVAVARVLAPPLEAAESECVQTLGDVDEAPSDWAVLFMREQAGPVTRIVGAVALANDAGPLRAVPTGYVNAVAAHLYGSTPRPVS